MSSSEISPVSTIVRDRPQQTNERERDLLL